MDSVLFDSSFVYALYNSTLKDHDRALEFGQKNNFNILVPDVVLPEVTFLFRRFGGVRAVAAFLDAFVKAQSSVECISQDDMKRSREIMLRYNSAQLDFVDCCIAAFAERLNIKHIATFDRRDFGIIRPLHCPYFELLP
jgi:uncharacterized protein